MLDAEPFSDEAVFRRDDVAVAVTWEFCTEAVARLAGAAAANAVGHDNEMARGVERLAFAEKLVRERREEPILARAAGAVQQHDAVVDLAGGVPMRRTEYRVVQLQLGQGLAAVEDIVLEHEVALALVRPGDLRRGRQGDGEAS